MGHGWGNQSFHRAPQFSPCQGRDEYLITSGQVQRGQGADPELEEKIQRKPLVICYIAIEDVPFIDGLPEFTY